MLYSGKNCLKCSKHAMIDNLNKILHRWGQTRIEKLVTFILHCKQKIIPYIIVTNVSGKLTHVEHWT